MATDIDIYSRRKKSSSKSAMRGGGRDASSGRGSS